MVTITVGAPTQPASERLYGVFFEDINHGADGGLNANMVNNYSFDGVYLRHESLRLKGADRWRTEADPLRNWRFDGLSATSCGTEIRGDHGQRIVTDCPAPPIHRNSRYVRLTVDAAHGDAAGVERDAASIENLGYNGDGDYADSCAMSIAYGHDYEFCACIRPVAPSVDGTPVSLHVVVLGADDRPLTDDVRFDVDRFAGELLHDGWIQVRHRLPGLHAGYGKLHIDVTGGQGASFDLDLVSLMDADYWGAGDPKWRFGRMRRDLVESIAALRPAFVRFPGGCIVEGVTPGNEYRWKDTVGAPPARRQQANMWAFKTPDGSTYSQSYQLGFYEYFCLCEDLGAKPLPTLFAGLTCQSPYRDPKHVDTDSDWFRSVVVQDYLDLIDFANGDPDTSAWAAVRRDMGHPEPFGLDMIGVGNENFGADYIEKFDAISRAIHAKDPHMLCVMSAGLFPFRLPMSRAWNHAHQVAAGQVPGVEAAPAGAGNRDATAREPGFGHPSILVDEHAYHSPEWFISQVRRFDDYRRDSTGVYFGEYSANGYFAAQPQDYDHASQWRSALAEAAFLTGCERNADIVKMTSYAPLLSHVTGHGWEQNLIEFNPAHVQPSVNYEAERLFSTNYGSFICDCHSDEETDDLYVCATGDDPDAAGSGDVRVQTGDNDRVCNRAQRFIKLVNTGGTRIGVTLNVTIPVAGTAETLRSLHVETLTADPYARNTLGYIGAGHDCVTRAVRDSVLPQGSGPVHVSLALPPYSLTLVRLS
ncbi:alpha-L-arabinofuranosidase C-terminal domain-containing protein [Bifidobacterium simiiventris]|uniref:alpha-L-arabinofuranosidase C-terminal domain-containing protein n=1 Tax=Bifidobacterium simiiventris TaxID=2834434 RepID=UPI001C5953CD|nr:alpha-L-arabinofuranosidase C-terminal domain-containing protein [Bifidobacterium simiiventris]MBW3077986.1 alpha-L-arabinofuranosidase [Bifidobacterium simiiventris]